MTVNKPGYQAPPEILSNSGEHRRQLARAVRGLMEGKANVTLDVTLAANAASTTVSDSRIGFYSALILVPLSADAAAALPTTFISTLSKGVAVLSHANAASTDRSFRLVILG
jgi:hypothetical protein